MQKLQFELSWDKTLSIKDRERIKQAFLETSFSNHQDFQLTPLWEAFNHKGELLVTVLIHNFGKENLSFNNKKLCYFENNEIVAHNTFTLSKPIVEQETSMPWTFIFPAPSFFSHATLENGHIEIC